MAFEAEQLITERGTLNKFMEKFGFDAPTATQVRKIGSTVTALNASSAETALITKQMSHTASVHAKHYEAIELSGRKTII